MYSSRGRLDTCMDAMFEHIASAGVVAMSESESVSNHSFGVLVCEHMPQLSCLFTSVFLCTTKLCAQTDAYTHPFQAYTKACCAYVYINTGSPASEQTRQHTSEFWLCLRCVPVDFSMV